MLKDKLYAVFSENRIRQVYNNRLRPTFWVKNADIHFKQSNIILYNKLKKKYSKILNKLIEPKLTLNNSKIRESIVWVCWLQGEEKAPDLVKACISSIRNSFGIDNVKIITANNYLEYIDLPNYILEKWHKKKISPAHFSDLIRLALLIEYGGLWIDSTVYCTSKEIPAYLKNSDFFVHSNILRGDQTIVAENWFIKSPPQHKLLLLTQKLLYEYWKKNNSAESYFIFHLFFTMATEKYVDQWENVPKVSSVDPHMMNTYLFKEFTEEKFDYLKEISCYHKLSNKNDYTLAEKNSFYYFLV